MKALIIIITVAACFASTAVAEQTNRPSKPSPEHQKLALWFGEWTYETENETTFLGPGGKFTGRMTGRPILDGFGAELLFVETGPAGETRTVEIDGYDPVAKNYPGMWMCGDGSLGQGTFTMNGNVATWEGTSMANGKRFKDRGTDAVAPDGMSFTKRWEISEDGKTWVPFSTFKATKVTPPAPERSQVDRIAESYVKLVLAVGQHDAEYVDSYYGPPAWQEQAAARKLPLGEIRQQVVRARDDLAAINPSGLDEMETLRLRFLGKQLDSVKARIDVLSGVKMTFDEESAAVWDAVAPDYPDAHFKEELARVDALVPGTGTLRERFEKFRGRFIVPKEKAEAVFRAAMQEARLRTRRHIQLPEGEQIRIECVAGKPWTASSRCLGNGQSVIQLNMDTAFTIDELLYLACHEGYPGHHVTNLLLEDRLARRRGWSEFNVYPLHGPLSLISEGIAVYSMELAFPLGERIAFEREVLYPLAGLDPALVPGAAPIFDVADPMSNPWSSDASPTAARKYLDGQVRRSEMLEWLKARTLVSSDQAELIGQFVSQYRSYMISYTVGRDLVQRHMEKRAGADQEKRWRELERLQTPPKPPSDLR